ASDWSSDVCSSDLGLLRPWLRLRRRERAGHEGGDGSEGAGGAVPDLRRPDLVQGGIRAAPIPPGAGLRSRPRLLLPAPDPDAQQTLPSLTGKARERW